MQNKQQKIDELFSVIDKRIVFHEKELSEATAKALNSKENVMFSRFVKAKVKEILGLTDEDDDDRENPISSASDPVSGGVVKESISFVNCTGRAAMPGDVVMSKGKNNLVLVKLTDRKKYQDDGYSVDGVYVISNTGETGMLSLFDMSCETPEAGYREGDNGGRLMCFGGFGVHVEGLTNYGDEDSYQIVIDRGFNNNGFSRYGYLPSDKFINSGGAKSQIDGKMYYFDDDDNLLPPPFNANGTPNELFGKGRNIPSFLSDASSRTNTNAIVKMATAQQDWPTAKKIVNSGEGGYYPAACCCRRFHTAGTNAGDWDLPAIPVLACLMYNWNAVQDTLKSLAEDGLAGPLSESNGYWSSSEVSQRGACYLGTGSGSVFGSGKGYHLFVRAFRSLPRI
ncbi:MAG: hypothetical protein IJ640_00190 [Prevotella sp.]|nr:hypothetical protein [Prevotella sp.]